LASAMALIRRELLPAGSVCHEACKGGRNS
jgi:hypothetical protein